MSQAKNLIRLITFAQAEKGDDKPPVVETIAIPLKKKRPGHRLVCLYGNPMAALKRIRQKAIKNNIVLHRVDLDIDRGQTVKGNTSLDNIGSTKLLTLDRINTDLAKELTLIMQEGQDDASKASTPNAIAGENPELINLIWEDPRFAHLSVIVWSAPLYMDKAVFEKRAALKSLDLIVKKDIRNYAGNPEDVRFLI